MAEPPVTLYMTGTRAFEDLHRRLTEAGCEGLRANLRRELDAASKPMVTELRAAVMSVESRAQGWGGGSRRRAYHAVRIANDKDRARGTLRRHSSGLRATIARAITVKLSLSASAAPSFRIVVDPAKLPAGQRKLPKYMDSGKGWRHPVYGNREAWVTQTANPSGWWTKTIRQHLPRIRERITAAMTRTADQIEH